MTFSKSLNEINNFEAYKYSIQHVQVPTKNREFNFLRYSSASNRLRIIVLGYIIRGPLGGLIWHHLQYLMGLRDLGHDVYFVEDSDNYPSCYDPSRHVTDTDPSYGLRFAAETFDHVGLENRWSYFDYHTNQWRGPCAEQILGICRSADILLNISGANPMRHWFESIPIRVFIDTDPLFTQIRHLKNSEAMEKARCHTAFLSYGENIKLPGCTIPTDGLPWQATRQPVVLDAWPVKSGPSPGNFTTIMQWQSYPAVEYNGRQYCMKSKSFQPFLDFPEKVGQGLEIAMGNSKAPRSHLIENGWKICNPLEISKNPWTYQRYIQNSRGEFSVAKHGYVASHSGWFSERSAVYLASGRPVVIEDTGFSDWLEVGSGVFPFKTPGQAAAGIEEINSNYEFHCRNARTIAEAYFDAKKVLPQLIYRIENPYPDIHDAKNVTEDLPNL